MKNSVIINLKHYEISSGKSCERFLSSFIGMDIPENIRVVFALNPIDLRIARNFPELEFYSQHVDSTGYGAFTAKISMESLMDLGISGSIINHSENRLNKNVISGTLDKAARMDFPVVVCSENLAEAGEYSRLKPEFVAYEPPELIGGDISVTSSKPDIIRDVVSLCSVNGVSVLVGAGIKNSDDFRKSLELGAHGVLLASGIVLSKDPLRSLNSLIEKL
ncbi:MAG: triose-phosphate isomerase [Candidatus Thermoplasmatota archaeon]|nr:triose-phosphate isomerase [Candidatus Thermoplasmatota archaeon]